MHYSIDHTPQRRQESSIGFENLARLQSIENKCKSRYTQNKNVATQRSKRSI